MRDRWILPALVIPATLLLPLSPLRAESGFVRGDTDGDGEVSIADAVQGLQHLFAGRELTCQAAADVNDSGDLDITDPIHLLQFLFLGGEEPAPPWPRCGRVTGAAERLGCIVPPCVLELEPVLVWVGQPDGCMQCTPCARRSAEDVARELVDEGFAVYGSDEAFPFPVCMACEVCPSGRYYMLLVDVADLPELTTRGWMILRDGGIIDPPKPPIEALDPATDTLR